MSSNARVLLDPTSYHRFLEFLNKYARDEMRPLDIFEQMSTLFADHQGFLNKFAYFSSDGDKEAAKIHVHAHIDEAETKHASRRRNEQGTSKSKIEHAEIYTKDTQQKQSTGMKSPTAIFTTVQDSEGSSSDDEKGTNLSMMSTRKRARFEAHKRRASDRNDSPQQGSASFQAQFQTFAELYEDYLSLQKVNETLSQTLHEAEIQLHNQAKKLKAKEKELEKERLVLYDKANELQAKEKELHDISNGGKNQIEKDNTALKAAQKKEAISNRMLRRRNREIEKKDQIIKSKDSTFKAKEDEVKRLQQEIVLISKVASPIEVKGLPKDLQKELECPICFDPFEDPCIVPECCHRFCSSCIESSIKSCGNECPLCRKRVTSKRALRKDVFIERITRIIFGKRDCQPDSTNPNQNK